MVPNGLQDICTQTNSLKINRHMKKLRPKKNIYFRPVILLKMKEIPRPSQDAKIPLETSLHLDFSGCRPAGGKTTILSSITIDTIIVILRIWWFIIIHPRPLISPSFIYYRIFRSDSFPNRSSIFSDVGWLVRLNCCYCLNLSHDKILIWLN